MASRFSEHNGSPHSPQPGTASAPGRSNVQSHSFAHSFITRCRLTEAQTEDLADGWTNRLTVRLTDRRAEGGREGETSRQRDTDTRADARTPPHQGAESGNASSQVCQACEPLRNTARDQIRLPYAPGMERQLCIQLRISAAVFILPNTKLPRALEIPR